jgi:PTH2 family peptidyl-tRNA hydrolase
MAKQVIVMRRDLNMGKGKMIAQGGHAILGVILKTMNNGKSLQEEMPEIIDGKYKLTLEVEVGSDLDQWLRGVFKKVSLTANSEKELLEIYQKALDANLPVKLIEDNGLTTFHGIKTKTCLAIGPGNEEEINQVTGHLKLLP